MSSLHFYASELLQKWHNCVVFLQQQARDAIEGGRHLSATFAAKISFSGFQATAARSFRSTFISTAAPGSGGWLPEVVERYGVSTERSSKSATPAAKRYFLPNGQSRSVSASLRPF